MKSWPQVFLAVSVLCLFLAANGIAGPRGSVGSESNKETRTSAPLAEMMFYEAAEQAVEDGYARIITESESKTPQDAADTISEQAGQTTTRSGANPQNRKE